MRRELMLHTMSGEERHSVPLDGSDGDRSGGLAVRGVDLDVFDVIEKGVKARAPEDPDADRLAAGGRGAQADFSFALRAALAPFFADRPLPDSDSPPDRGSRFEPDSFFEPDSLFEPEPPAEAVLSLDEVSLFSPSPEPWPLFDRAVLESVA
jgi:hypothetical protein